MSAVPVIGGKKPELSDDEREKIIQLLLKRFDETKKKLEHGAINETALAVHLSRKTISRIWERARANYEKDSIYSAPSHKKNCGVRPKDFSQPLKNIESVPLNRRSTIRSLAQAIDVPRSTLHRKFKEGFFKRVSSAIRPFLTEENKKDRVRFCRTFVQPNGYFDPMYDLVHIDEKWFFMTKTQRQYYLTAEEETPYRTCKSKRYIGKIMFMAAVARPRPGFDGKLGIWPFVRLDTAKRKSKNRPRGAPITVPVNADRDEVRKMIIEKVLPAIRAKFPEASKPYPIVIQQDNAKPHLLNNDAEFEEAASIDGWTIGLRNQPANSPDLNVLDLGFFNSIQALQYRAAPRDLDDLILEVESAFEELKPETLDNVWVTLQSCMEKIMETNGGNDYKIPHMNKARLRRERGQMLSSIQCGAQAFEQATSFLDE